MVEPAHAAGPEYRAFWQKLQRGEPVIGSFKRIAKGGREIWMQASYNPIADIHGKPFKVVEYATDVTEQMVRNADHAGQLAAIDRAQAVVEFDMDGTVRKINENFARVMGYSAGEVVGKHHSMFADAGVAGSAEYRAFRKYRDDYELAGLTINSALDPSVLEVESGITLHEIGGTLRYDNVVRVLGGAGGWPLQLHLRFLRAVSGGGGQTPVTTRAELGVRFFRRLWGS